MLTEAETYLGRGFSVIPLYWRNSDGSCACRDPACKHPGKHPLIQWAEYQRRRASEQEVRSWWSSWPQANIGLVCGDVSGGLAVLDIDELALTKGVIEEKLQTRVVATPSGGAHVYLIETAAHSASGTLISGIADFKANGGFVVAPPSHGYELIQDGEPLCVPNGREWALKALGTWGIAVKDGGPERRAYEAFKEGPIEEGARDETLTSLGGLLRAKGFNSTTLLAVLGAVNEKQCRPPLEHAQVEKICHSLERYPAGSSQDTIPAPYETELARNEFWRPIPITALSDAERIHWVWEGYVPEGGLVLLTGLWKAGKTTLLAALLKGMDRGGSLAEHAIKAGRVLVISEESRGMWRGRREDFELKDNVYLICRPFSGKSRWGDWQKFIDFVAGEIASQGFRLVIMDTLPSFWPVWDENAASEVVRALGALQKWMKAGAAVVLAHHPRKGDATEGQAARGSGALPAFVDVIIEFRRYDPARRGDTRRVLTTYSRFDESPPEIVLDFEGGQYTVVGTKQAAKQTDRWTTLSTILPTEQPGKTVQEIREMWPSEGPPKPGQRTVEEDLKKALEGCLAESSGKGRKGDPFRFWLKNSIPASPTPLVREGNRVCENCDQLDMICGPDGYTCPGCNHRIPTS